MEAYNFPFCEEFIPCLFAFENRQMYGSCPLNIRSICGVPGILLCFWCHKKTVSKVGCDMIILYVCNRIMVDYGRAAGLSWMVFLAPA